MAKQSSFAPQEDLCNWEFINQSDFIVDDDDDDDSIYEVQSIDLVESLDSLSSSSSSEEEEEEDDVDDEEEEEEEEKGPTNDVESLHHHDDDMMESPSHTPHDTNFNHAVGLGQNHLVDDGLSHGFDGDLVKFALNRCYHESDRVDYDVYAHDDGESDDVDDDDYDDDGGYDMDDELVPWGVKDKFERQRLRKLGKRAFAKMTKSKKSALLYTKPGCVRGKHGLGAF